jgi:hypothetical protein
MSIADIFNVPTTPEEMAKWSSLHSIQHRLTNAAVLASHGIALQEFILDPINLDDPVQFFLQHQQAHNAVDAIYGISGFDLEDVNWSDPGQRAGWIYLNATLHEQEAQATGAY